MPPKAKARQGGGRDLLEDKVYKDKLKQLFDTTPVQPRDIDQKVIGLLDALQTSGRVPDAIQHLKTSLEGVQREKVQSWRAYVYTLLRGFDPGVYASMKEKSTAGRLRVERQHQKGGAAAGGEDKDDQDALSNKALNSSAPEFVPGQMWLNPMYGMQGHPFPMMMMPPPFFPQAASGPPPQSAPEMPEPPPPPPPPAEEAGKKATEDAASKEESKEEKAEEEKKAE
mmetsp:Transcript_3109/g.7004  ORF Transcript_3109/g.7004 Transcript_3109/m.7004 type:complete len:226 (+) Transcript_3109:84-761(+)